MPPSVRASDFGPCTKQFENCVEHLRRNAFTVVLNRDNRIIALLPQCNNNVPTGRRILAGVPQQVFENLQQSRRIAFYI